MSGPLEGGAGRRRLLVPASVGIIGLAVLGFGQGVANRHATEDDLTSRSTKALKSAGLKGLSVSFSGRDATISGAPTAEQSRNAEDVVDRVDGVQAVQAITEPSAAAASSTAPTTVPSSAISPAAPTAPTAPTAPSAPTAPTAATAATGILPVGFTLVDGTITVTGTVGSKAAGMDLIDAVTMAGNGWQVVDRLNINGSLTAPEPKPSRLSAVTQLLAQASMDSPKLVIQYNRGSVILRGSPADADAERALLTAAAATVNTKSAVIDGLDTPAAN